MVAPTVFVAVEGVEQVKATFDAALSPEDCRWMNREIGFTVQWRTADHIAKASDTRHRTADRLGAPHSGFLEFAPGRVKSESTHVNEDGSRGLIESENATAYSVDVVICNTPGLTRAFHDLVITPKKAKALTIPINAVSYAHSAGQLRSRGWKMHREGRVLKGSQTGGETLSLYVLCGRVVVPQDRGLLPTESGIAEWAAETAEVFIERRLADE